MQVSGEVSEVTNNFFYFYFKYSLNKRNLVLQYSFSFEQALRCWSETIEKEDQVEKQVLQRLMDASKVQFCIFTALSNEKVYR